MNFKIIEEDIELKGGVLDGTIYHLPDDTSMYYYKMWIGKGMLEYRRTNRMNKDGLIIFEFIRIIKNGEN